MYMHYPFQREVPSTLPKTELKLDRPFGEQGPHALSSYSISRDKSGGRGMPPAEAQLTRVER